MATGHLYELLTCPRCGASPQPASERCPGCNRFTRAASGGLDLLHDGLKPAADLFAAQYQALRAREGWSSPSGREDPEGGQESLWKGRVRSVQEVAALFAREWPSDARPVVADVGSGGGWAARLLPSVAVLAFDLQDVSPNSATVTVRADMRKLPIRDATIDTVLYAASLHHAPIEAALFEAARVLRPRGLMVAVDSPIYKNAQSQAQALARARAYYADAGFPGLADHYHPIDAKALRSALVDSGFEIERLNIGSGGMGRWPRLRRTGPASLVVARRVAPTGYARSQ